MTRTPATFNQQAIVLISSARVRSLLRNRGQAGSALEGLGSGTLASLVTQDSEVQFEDLLLLAKHFKRPWPYLLLDAEEEWRATTHDHRTLRNLPVGSCSVRAWPSGVVSGDCLCAEAECVADDADAR